MRATLLVLAGLLAPLPATAACTPPVPPSAEGRPSRPALPAKPACLDAKGGCPGWEGYSYNDAIKAYNAQIQAFRPLADAYVQTLNAYVKGSADYAQCEVKALQ
ncbi:hypothetical protein [Methylobacterium trifolii]|uniref:Uncharacterized protein n=1 Tax=Methylobacterium trifolii TaxID=1003092 RepID=A0ABQ4U3Q7_9HYPH|nr:hypothetical protein [Methylobacterium trifolii]GJE61787.1 hypothetical protein MPOCJGCO_3913 [Methylobacterium trifolii]